MGKYEDIEIKCNKCGVRFVWTKGEQYFLNRLQEEGKIDADVVIVPARKCPKCREEKKLRLQKLNN